jgi:hypothetical protein
MIETIVKSVSDDMVEMLCRALVVNSVVDRNPCIPTLQEAEEITQKAFDQAVDEAMAIIGRYAAENPDEYISAQLAGCEIMARTHQRCAEIFLEAAAALRKTYQSRLEQTEGIRSGGY